MSKGEILRKESSGISAVIAVIGDNFDFYKEELVEMLTIYIGIA